MATDLYTADVTATGGTVRSEDGSLQLDVHEATSAEGNPGGTNPEQLMAAALGSCLLESLKIAATSAGGSTEGARVRSRVTLSQDEGPGYAARYELSVTLPDAGAEPADVLRQALSICPFTKTLDAASLDVQLA